jgi:SAM-dependent methyltransferase
MDSSALPALRAWARRHVPAPARRSVRRLLAEAPHRLRDLPADLADRFRRDPLPPAALRARVGLSSSRQEFQAAGGLLARDLLAALAAVEPAGGAVWTAGRWLDFGCGCGRVVRSLLRAGQLGPGTEISGVDVDRPAVAWCRRHLPGRFEAGSELPPLAFPDGSFDLIYAVSVFTHLDEPRQDLWLAESARLLRPGGLLLASTHGPAVLAAQPDLTSAEREGFERRGFLFLPGAGRFNENRTFHGLPYLREVWGRRLTLEHHASQGLAGFQDLSVWRRPL